MPGPARVALVGYGLGGSVFHAPLIDHTEGLSLAAVVTSNPERQAAARQRYPATRIVAGMDDLLKDAGDFDLVVITTPNATHYPLAEAALKAGRPVVVDKPVTATAAEAGRLADLARSQGVSLIPYHNRRWDGDFLTVADLVEGGRLGTVWRCESRFERWRPHPPATATWKQDPAQAAAGILYDLGSHLVDQAVRLFGPPASVYAEQTRRASTVDDDVFMALDYHDGPSVHLWVSSAAAQWGPRFRVLGSEAAYVKYGMDPQEEALRAGRTPAEPGWGEEPAGAWGRLGTVEESGPLRTRAGAYQDFYAGVASHLGQGGPPPVAVADAVTGLRVIEAAARSAASRQVINL